MRRALVIAVVLGSITMLGGCRLAAHGPLTDRQFAVAVAVARQEGKIGFHTITRATATIGPGTVIDSNTGHACTSGTLLHIRVTGVDPKTVALSGDAVIAMDVTVDAVTSVTCLVGVETVGANPNLSGATVLFSD